MILYPDDDANIYYCDNKKILRSNFTMFCTVYLALLPFTFCLIKAQDLKFDDEGNVMNNDTPFNFHKLVASKVKGEEERTTITTTTKGE